MWVWLPEGRDNLVTGYRRATVLKTDDSGTQQILKQMRGLASELFSDVYRAQPHGFSSHAPAGSEGFFHALGGRSDRLIALGFEHKDHRVRDLPEGATALYDASGTILRLLPDSVDLDAGDKNVVIHNAKDVAVNNCDTITAVARKRAALGAGPGSGIRFVSVKASPQRVDLAVKSPDELAPYKVMTDGGASEVVWARID